MLSSPNSTCQGFPSKTLITLFRPEYQPEAFDNEDGRKYSICEVDGELPDGALDFLLRDRKWSAIHQEIYDGDVELYVSERKDELIRACTFHTYRRDSADATCGYSCLLAA